MSFFIADNISAGYGKENVVKEVSFSIESGCLSGILGANGSGKTTLLKAICGIISHSGGCSLEGVSLEGLSPKELSRLCGYIPQRSGISIDISALDVVLMGFNPHLGLLESPTKQMKQAALQALTEVGLGDKAQQNYLHLSEGQKQLCILARTLVTDSKLLLLDEPESALDFRFRYKMLSLLRDYAKNGSKAALVSLHDPSLALNYCHRLLLVDEGRLIGIIHPETDSIEEMESLLCRIYGSISLQRCANRSGQTYLVMLKENQR